MSVRMDACHKSQASTYEAERRFRWSKMPQRVGLCPTPRDFGGIAKVFDTWMDWDGTQE
jgi:hypothetical protein